MFCFSALQTALHLAAYNGHTAVCDMLIAGRADVNAKDRCAFMFNLCYWCCVVVRFWNLLLIFRSSCGDTSLHDAARNGHKAVCELLIAGKADVNAKNRCAFVFKMCFWFCVALKICYWFCVVLRFLSFFLIFCCSDLQTALIRASSSRAAYYGYTDVCQLLIAAKADVNANDRCAFLLWKFATDFAWWCVLKFTSDILL